MPSADPRADLRFAGAVLTGGASRRMGTDKARVRVAGVAMADRVATALARAGARAVVTVGGPGAGVADLEPGAGPLAGVVAALRWCPEPVLVVAPCDLLEPDPAAFTALAAATRSAAAAVPTRRQPLPLALRVADARPLARAFAAGERALHRALAGLATVEVALDPAAIADADTPDDLPPGTG